MGEKSQAISMDDGAPVLEAVGIVKEFSGVRVLDQVDFELKRGEVHALLGENGAGKSTLIKILTGVYTKTQGTLRVEGKEVNLKSKRDADACGISAVYQEFSQVPQLSIVENLFLGRYTYKTILGGLLKWIDWRGMRRSTRDYLKQFNLDVDPTTPVKKLGVAKQQLVEIMKALLRDAKILLLDEPTASLSGEEIEQLFTIISELKKRGVSIIYISHHLEEAKRICDRATIIRDGKKVATLALDCLSIDDIIKMMVGKELKDLYPEKNDRFGDVILKLEGLSSGNKFRNVGFEVRSGEIVGVTGLIGAGKTEIARTIFGIDPRTSGKVYVNGKEAQIGSPKEAQKYGIALVPEDRKMQGVITKLRAFDNIVLPSLDQYKNRMNYIDNRKEKESVHRYMKEVDIRPREPEKLAQYFSGGNQQKIVVSKWLSSKAQLYIFDEPTRGIDIGARVEIYRLIAKLSRSGNAILIFSSEIGEIIGMCHKIIVMKKGDVVSVVNSNETNIESILKAQVGGVADL